MYPNSIYLLSIVSIMAQVLSGTVQSMMGHNPYLDMELKLTVHLRIAVVLYHTEGISKGYILLVNQPMSYLQRAWGVLVILCHPQF
jgi:hypothetical protein